MRPEEAPMTRRPPAATALPFNRILLDEGEDLPLLVMLFGLSVALAPMMYWLSALLCWS